MGSDHRFREPAAPKVTMTRTLLSLILCMTMPAAAAVTEDCVNALTAEQDRFVRTFGDDARLMAWINQFESSERPTALNLVRRADFVSQHRLKDLVRALHAKVLARAAADGVSDPTKLTYTRMYTAKSGDLISYYYRAENLIPARRFVNVEALISHDVDPKGRALVLIDDYAGTGAQFLTEYYGRDHAGLFNRYDRIYLVVVAAHARAIARFEKIAAGRNAEVAEEFIAEFGASDLDATMAREGLARTDSQRLGLIFELRDEGFTLDATETAFLEKYGPFKRNPDAPFGVAGLRSAVGFFFGPPNGMPDLFWNSTGRFGTSPLTPLFARTEDVSNYNFARDLPETEQVWGGSSPKIR